MKKLLAFLLAMSMLLCLCACGDDSGNTDDNKDKGKGSKTSATVNEDEGNEDATQPTNAEDTDADASDPTESKADPTESETDPIYTTGSMEDNTTAATEGTTAKPTEVEVTTPVTQPSTSKPTSTTTTKKPTTASTTKPTEPEEPDEPVDDRPTIKILSIGHSFSRDAMDTYMADLFKAAGYNATFGYLYYPGASLERQYHYVKDDSASYEMYNKCVDGKWYYSDGKQKASTALADEDWDIVTFQPSPDYGKGTMESSCEWGCQVKPKNDYVHFDALVSNVRSQLKAYGNTDVKFYYHLTWSFASDCKLWSFTYSNYNQNTMYWDFIRATAQYVLPNPYIEDKYIPCNTAIQNVRTSWMGDTFNEPGNYDPNADGYHLNDKGDLVAAMTWVAFFTGKSATEFKIDTKYSDRQYAAFAEAVDAAIKKPLDITKSTYTTES